jgi:hypothetical protein
MGGSAGRERPRRERPLPLSQRDAESEGHHLMAHQRYDFRGEPIEPSRLKRIKRQTAEELVSKLLSRAKDINADAIDRWPFFVEKLVLFGSILSDTLHLGDVDVGYMIARNDHWSVDYVTGLAREFGNPRSHVDELCWCERETRRRLRGRNYHISLHEYSEVKRLGCPYRVIFAKNEA